MHAVGELNTIGRGCNAEDLVRVQQELSQGLEQDVLTPMKQWLFAWSTVQARLKELEEMRIEVDSRKRQVFNLRQKETKMKENLDSSSNDHQRKVREKKLEETWRMQQRKVIPMFFKSSIGFLKLILFILPCFFFFQGCETSECHSHLSVNGVRGAGGACRLD